jgi:hypothetical protein
VICMEIAITPSHGLVLLRDAETEELPRWERGTLVLGSGSCIVIGTYPPDEGPTVVQISDAHEEDRLSDLVEVFAGRLSAPSSRVVLADVLGGVYAQFPAEPETSVRVLANHEVVPDRIRIALGPGVER